MSDELFTLLIIIVNILWVGAVGYLIGKYRERERAKVIAKSDRVIRDREISALKTSMNKVWDHIKPEPIIDGISWEDTLIKAWNRQSAALVAIMLEHQKRIDERDALGASADIYWQLLRSLEEKCGSKAGALDKDLIKQAYAHYNKVMGTKLEPTYAT